MRWMWSALLVPAALGPGTIGAQAPAAPTPADTAAHPITLTEAVDLAQRNSPTTIQSRGAVRAGAAGVRSAWAAFIPNVSLNASSSRAIGVTNRVDPLTNRLLSGKWSQTQAINASVDLFDGGQRLFNMRSARATQAAAEASDIAARYDVSLSVKQQYYAVLAAREAEAAARAQLAQGQQDLQFARAKVKAQTSTRSDSLRALIEVGNAQLALLTARNDLQSANASLTRLVATPFTVTASPADTGSFTLAPVDSAALEQEITGGPLVRQAQASETAAQAAARAARTPYLPTLSVNYGLNRSSTDTTFFGTFDQYQNGGQLRFTVTYPLFNQLTREENIVRADVAATNAEAAARDARLAAQQSFIQFLGALRTAEQQIAIQTVSVTAAEEDLRVQQQRYQLGASTLLDVLTSQATLNQARAALIQARFNYRVARAQLSTLVGREL